MAADPIRPSHYTSLTPEPIVVIEAWQLGFSLGNALKYIARAGKKGDTHQATIEDLEKARWYINRHIEVLSREHRIWHSKFGEQTAEQAK